MVKIVLLRAVVGVGAISMWVVGCNSSQPTAQNSPTPQSSQTPIASPSVTPTAKPDQTATPKSESVKTERQKTEPEVTSTAKPDQVGMTTRSSAVTTVPVQVYRSDGACGALVPKTEALPKEKTLEAAVGSVIRNSNSADFTVSDYRVTQAGEKATIVLRLPPTAKRPFTAMSSCEQMALFGALRETVVGRSDWKIREVTFSDGKKEIEF
jgi:hypothetical protein